MNKEEIILLIKQQVSNITKENVNKIDITSNFFYLGISSIEALKIVEHTQKSVGVEIEPIALFQYQSIEAFADYVCGLLNKSECVLK